MRNSPAYFADPHTANDPAEAINGGPEYLRSYTLRFQNLTQYITRALLEIGRFKPQLHPIMKSPIRAHINEYAVKAMNRGETPLGSRGKTARIIVLWTKKVMIVVF